MNEHGNSKLVKLLMLVLYLVTVFFGKYHFAFNYVLTSNDYDVTPLENK